jgi:P-type Cu+ transporter
MIDENRGRGMREQRSKVSFSVTGMTCAACARRVEKAAVEFEPSSVSEGKLAGVVEAVGYGVAREEDQAPEGEYRALRADFLVAALTALVLIGSLSYMLGFGAPIPMGWLNVALLALATPVQFWAGRRFYRGAWGALRHGGADMNTLVVVGTSAAYLYSAVATLAPQFFAGRADVYFDTSALIITLILLGRLLEARARSRAGEAIKRLAALGAKTARVVRDGEERDVCPSRTWRSETSSWCGPGRRCPWTAS